MVKNIVLISQRMLAFGCGLTVLLLGLSFDPEQIMGLINRIQPVLHYEKVMVQGIRISQSRAVYCLSENMAGFAPDSKQYFSLRDAMDRTGVVIDEPEAMMAANIHPLSFFEEYASAEGNDAADKQTAETDMLPVMADTSVDLQYSPVGFYCTHNAESYYPGSKKSRVEGGKGLINQVGLSMANELEKIGIQAVFDSTVHDSPDYNMAYSKSRQTVERLSKDSNWSAFIDVHRDAIPDKKAPVVVEVDEKMAAQMLIIVGSDERKPNPDWGENLNFAEKIFKTGEKMYPGLIRGVRIKPGTYNQEIHPPSILLEVGNEYNSLDEARYSSKLFAEILSSVIKEGK